MSTSRGAGLSKGELERIVEKMIGGTSLAVGMASRCRAASVRVLLGLSTVEELVAA
jgi:hypothetical protein